MPSIITVSHLEDLCVGLPGAEERQSGNPPRRDLRAARAQRRRQDDADQHLCGIVNPTEGTVPVDGHDIITDYRAARSMIGLVPQELTTDAFETVWATVTFSRGLFGKPRQSGAYRESAEGPLAVGQEGQQDHDALGRHEAPGADRQGAVARAADPVPRRADGRRRRRAAQGHVGAGARAARLRRHHHPHHPLYRGSRGDGRPHRRHQQGRDRSWSRKRPS